MKRFLKYAAIIATVLMVSSSGWATTYNNHIAMSPNNKGDAMIFPWYIALNGGWETKLTVINTDQVNSVVAKVAIKSPKNSSELLDFLIYLSPADVWTGIIWYNGSTVNLYSTDDSIVTDTTPTFASATNPVNESLGTKKCADDTSGFGYVEVIMAAYGPVKNSAGVTAPGVAKSTIYGLYALLNATTNTVTNTTTGSTLSIGSENVLAGYMEFMNPLYGLSTTLPATTFINYHNIGYLGVGTATVFGEYSSSSIAEIEAALAKNDVAMPYVSGTDTAYHMFTYVTKHTDFTVCDAVTTIRSSSSFPSPYFNRQNIKTTCDPITSKTFDLTEQSKATPFSGKGSTVTLCWEVNPLTPVTYPEGWAYYNFTNATTTNDYTKSTTTAYALAYEGSPVIPSYFYLGTNGLTSAYGAWTDSRVWEGVTTATTLNEDYHYTNLPYEGL